MLSTDRMEQDATLMLPQARSDIICGGDHLMSTKSSIYKFLRLWNDVSAVKKGKVGKRIGRRLAGKTTGRLLRKLFK